jgi:hypothetical protein
MVSSASIPWYNRPPREFPVKRWMRQRYGFSLPPLAVAPPTPPARVAMPERRRFPAKVWAEDHTRKSLAKRQQSG